MKRKIKIRKTIKSKIKSTSKTRCSPSGTQDNGLLLLLLILLFLFFLIVIFILLFLSTSPEPSVSYVPSRLRASPQKGSVPLSSKGQPPFVERL